MNILNYIFSHANFLPHFHCFAGDDVTRWLNVFGNFGIATAYMIISFKLLKFLKKQDPDVIKGRKIMISLFASFIFSCGITHYFDILVIWYPYYRIQTIWVLWTALISLFTAFYMKQLNKLKVNSYKLFDKSIEVTEIELPPKKL